MKRKEPEREASAGSLGRLWAEFNDPGPAGDAPIFLKKYLEGIVPGCMGLLFMAVGILVAVLFAGQPDNAGKKTLLPVGFGGLFALVGFGVLLLGARTIARKSARRPK